MLKRHARWVLVFAGWLVIGLAFALNYYLFADHYVAIFKNPPTFKEMMVWELPYWIIWAALSPLIFRLTRHFRFERQNWPISLLVHISACVGISIGHRAIYLIVGWALHVAVYQTFTSISELYDFLFFFNLPTGFMSYGLIMLVSYVINYYEKYQKEELKASRLKAELAEAHLQATQAQLHALKMQLHPHFLFNTLNSISALLEEDPVAADKMVARLGEFLRLTLDNSGAQEVSLQQELEFLRCYLDIERIRFGDRLTVEMNIEPQALGARVPNLLLQPIVENSIRHGIAPRAAPGRIEIQAERDNGHLRLRIKDNGPGLPVNGHPASGFKQGLGLANTRERLQQLYGDAHRFQMDNAPEGGLEVKIEIPYEEETDGDGERQDTGADR